MAHPNTIDAIEVPATHYAASGVSDRFALGVTKLLRWGADTFFAKRYGNRAIVLETVAAVPGMVGATLNAYVANVLAESIGRAG